METTATQKKFVHLYTEANPNPNSLKFAANFMLVPEGSDFDYPSAEAAANSPLAQALFGFEGIERVFFMANFVTLTKSADYEWAELSPQIKNFLREWLEAEKTIVDLAQAASEARAAAGADSPLESRIKSLLDEYVRPAVESDGGAISFRSFNEGVVTVELRGSCSGCPSSTLTLKSGIENLLKRMVPEVQSVVAEGV